MNYRTFSFAISAVVALTSVSAVASQPESSDRYESIVAVGDIDAATPEGAKALDRKVRIAAQDVCSRALRGDQFSVILERICIRRTVAETRPQVERVVATAQRAQLAETAVAIGPQR